MDTWMNITSKLHKHIMWSEIQNNHCFTHVSRGTKCGRLAAAKHSLVIFQQMFKRWTNNVLSKPCRFVAHTPTSAVSHSHSDRQFLVLLPLLTSHYITILFCTVGTLSTFSFVTNKHLIWMSLQNFHVGWGSQQSVDHPVKW